jgi:hypothetical protein
MSIEDINGSTEPRGTQATSSVMPVRSVLRWRSMPISLQLGLFLIVVQGALAALANVLYPADPFEMAGMPFLSPGEDPLFPPARAASTSLDGLFRSPMAPSHPARSGRADQSHGQRDLLGSRRPLRSAKSAGRGVCGPLSAPALRRGVAIARALMLRDPSSRRADVRSRRLRPGRGSQPPG